MKFNNVRLLVANYDQCYFFYKDILGLECTFGKLGEAYASFKVGEGISLGIFKADLMAQAVKNTSNFHKTEGMDNFAIIFEVEDLEKTYQKLLANGVDFVNHPSDMPDWGIKIAHFRDPDGNLLEIFSPL
jgi:lactoylglutathione lyase